MSSTVAGERPLSVTVTNDFFWPFMRNTSKPAELLVSSTASRSVSSWLVDKPDTATVIGPLSKFQRGPKTSSPVRFSLKPSEAHAEGFSENLTGEDVFG